MAASNYSVNIKIDTKAARTELQTLEKRISNFRQNLNQPLKIDTRVSKIQENIAKSKDAQKASMIETPPFRMLFVSGPVKTIPASKYSRNS